jgi:hypothetical protein
MSRPPCDCVSCCDPDWPAALRIPSANPTGAGVAGEYQQGAATRYYPHRIPGGGLGTPLASNFKKDTLLT